MQIMVRSYHTDNNNGGNTGRIWPLETIVQSKEHAFITLDKYALLSKYTYSDFFGFMLSIILLKTSTVKHRLRSPL